MFNLFFLFVCLSNQSNQSVLTPPSVEVTQAKVNALTEKMSIIKEKTDKLNSLNIKLEVQGDQDVESFVNDSIFVLKLRADILIQLVDIFEDALAARYNLEATLEEYNNWIKSAMGNEVSRSKFYEDKAEALEKENRLILDETTVLTDLLQRKLKSHIEKISTKITDINKDIDSEQDLKKKAQFNVELRSLEALKLKHSVSLEEKTTALLDKNNKRIQLITITNRNDYEKKYEITDAVDSESSIQQFEDKLEALKSKYNDNSFEVYMIKNNILNKNETYLKKLRAEQRKLIDQSNNLLKQTKDYSFKAQKVYIASKYVKIMIDEARKAGGDISNLAIALDSAIKNEPYITSALDAAAGSAPANANLRELINKRFEINDKDLNEKDVKVDKDSDKDKKQPTTSEKSK